MGQRNTGRNTKEDKGGLSLKLHGGTTISPFLLGAIICLCAAPAITLNVWPRIEAMIVNGLTSNEVGIALLVAASALGMTAVPFAMAKSPNRAFWWTTLSFGLGLATLNYIMAVGAIGKLSDHATAQATQALSRAQSLKDQLEELRAARRELGAFKPTSQKQLDAADEAVRLAEAAQRDECTKVGDFCRARVAQLQSRLSERAETAGMLALSLRANELETMARNIQKELGAVGLLPVSANPQAERIRSLVQLIWPRIATESVANGIIHFLAIAAELFALGMPRILATALSRPAAGGERLVATEVRGVIWELTGWGKKAVEGRRAANAAKGLPSPAEVNGVLASGKSPTALAPRSPAPAPEPAAALAEWRLSMLEPSPGSRLGTWKAYTEYKLWAAARNHPQVSFPAFDFQLTTAGVQKEAGARSFYLNVTLSKKLKVVA